MELTAEQKEMRAIFKKWMVKNKGQGMMLTAYDVSVAFNLAEKATGYYKSFEV